MSVSRKTDRPVGLALGIETDIRNLVNEELAGFGLIRESVKIKAGEDHDGDPVLFITVDHALIDEPIDLEVIHNFDSRLRDLVWNEGESRFVHIHHKYHDQQKLRRAA